MMSQVSAFTTYSLFHYIFKLQIRKKAWKIRDMYNFVLIHILLAHLHSQFTLQLPKPTPRVNTSFIVPLFCFHLELNQIIQYPFFSKRIAVDKVPESTDCIMFFSILLTLPFLWVWRRRWWTVFPSLSSFYTRCPQRIVTRCDSAFFLCSVLRFIYSHEKWAY